MRRSEVELDKMRRAGKVVAEMHEKTKEFIRPGVTTLEINNVAAEVIERRGATSNFLNYHGFPAVICTSPNDMIVHGIPGDYVLQEGDIISIDCGAIIEGYHGDAAYTAGPLGELRVPQPGAPPPPAGYFAGTDAGDPLVAPINSPQVLAKFPPTLLITATRGLAGRIAALAEALSNGFCMMSRDPGKLPQSG